MVKFKDLTGQKFGRLRVIKRAEDYISISGRKDVMFQCLCDCGESCIIRSSDLRYGHTKSCGCLFKETSVECHLKHGDSNSRLYRIWTDMKRRCYNVDRNTYKYYGGKGIKVCDEWKESYQVFMKWALSNGYAANLTLDRIDSNGDYEPSNCRWVTMKIQNNNKSNVRHITINGETHTLVEWSEISGINYDTLKSRVYRGLVGDKLLSRE